MGVTGGFHSHGGIFMGATRGPVHSKGKLTQWLGTWSGWLASRVHVARKAGQFGFDLSIPLP